MAPGSFEQQTWPRRVTRRVILALRDSLRAVSRKGSRRRPRLVLPSVVALVATLLGVVLVDAAPASADSPPVLTSATLVNDGALLSYTDASPPDGYEVGGYVWADSNDGGATQSYGPNDVETDAQPYDTENDLAGLGCASDQPCSFQVGAFIYDPADPTQPAYFSWSNWITPPRPPAPSLNSATIGNGGDDFLSYTAPANPAGLTLGGYPWESSLDGGATVYSSGSALQGPSPLAVSVLSCPAGQTCSFRISAVDGMWESPWSNWVTATPAQTPTVLVTDNSTGVATGGTVTFTATVTGTGGVTPTGVVTWTVTAPGGGSVLCASTTGPTGSSDVATYTCSITGVLAGNYTATAVYPGDSNYTAASGSDNTANVAKANPTVSVADNSLGVSTGGTVTFTATVTGIGGVPPTGTVMWTVTGPGGAALTCSTITGPTGSSTVATYTCSITGVLAGSYTATAVYPGDSNYTAASGSDNTANVAKANPTVSVADNSLGVSTGGTVTFTATVIGIGGVPPTGTVMWTVTGPGGAALTCSTITGPAGSSTVATYTCSITGVLAGSYTATAAYPGDSNYTSASGSDNTANVAKLISLCGKLRPVGPPSAPDYCVPPHWNTSPVEGKTPGVEPLNVIISAQSTVSLSDILQAMSGWGRVTTGLPTGGCLSPEQADVTGSGWATQQKSWRMTGHWLLPNCWAGNVLSLDGDENHARLWNQPIEGTNGAWFISASYETACVERYNRMEPLAHHRAYALKNLDQWWHCIDGSQGSIGLNGYNRGADDFVAAVEAAGKHENWYVHPGTEPRPPGEHGEGHDGTGPPFSGRVRVLTVDWL